MANCVQMAHLKRMFDDSQDKIIESGEKLSFEMNSINIQWDDDQFQHLFASMYDISGKLLPLVEYIDDASSAVKAFDRLLGEGASL